MKKTFITSLLLCLLSLNCSSQKTNTSDTEKPQKTISASTSISNLKNENVINLSLGKSHFFEQAETNITYLSLDNDNRCPPNTNCIMAGNAIVEMELMSTVSRPIKIKLSLIDEPRLGITKAYDFQGYRYHLVAVNSKLFPSKKFNPNTIDVKVEKIDKMIKNNNISR